MRKLFGNFVPAIVVAALLLTFSASVFAQDQSADRSVGAAPTLEITVTADVNFGYMGKAIIVPPGSRITVTHKSNGATSCTVGDKSGLNGTQEFVATESLNLTARCTGPTGTVADAYQIAVNNRGFLGVCEGALTAAIDQPVKFYFTSSGSVSNEKVKWSAVNAVFNTTVTDMGYEVTAAFTKAGTQTVTAVSEKGGIVGKCQVQVLGPQGVSLTPSVSRNPDGSLTVQAGTVNLPEGSFAISQTYAPRTRTWPFSNPTFSYTLYKGVAAGDSAVIPVPIPEDWRSVDVKFTSLDGATSFQLRLN